MLLCLEMEQTSVTDLIHYILADEVTDSHELLRPFLICVPSTQLHGDGAAPCDLTEIVHTEIKKSSITFYTALTNFECKAINPNQSCWVIKFYCPEFLLSKPNQPEEKGRRKECKQQGNQQAGLCVHEPPTVCIVLV